MEKKSMAILFRFTLKKRYSYLYLFVKNENDIL